MCAAFVVCFDLESVNCWIVRLTWEKAAVSFMSYMAWTHSPHPLAGGVLQRGNRIRGSSVINRPPDLYPKAIKAVIFIIIFWGGVLLDGWVLIFEKQEWKYWTMIVWNVPKLKLLNHRKQTYNNASVILLPSIILRTHGSTWRQEFWHVAALWEKLSNNIAKTIKIIKICFHLLSPVGFLIYILAVVDV